MVEYGLVFDHQDRWLCHSVIVTLSFRDSYVYKTTSFQLSGKLILGVDNCLPSITRGNLHFWPLGRYFGSDCNWGAIGTNDAGG